MSSNLFISYYLKISSRKFYLVTDNKIDSVRVLTEDGKGLAVNTDPIPKTQIGEKSTISHKWETSFSSLRDFFFFLISVTVRFGDPEPLCSQDLSTCQLVNLKSGFFFIILCFLLTSDQSSPNSDSSSSIEEMISQSLPFTSIKNRSPVSPNHKF